MPKPLSDKLLDRLFEALLHGPVRGHRRPGQSRALVFGRPCKRCGTVLTEENTTPSLRYRERVCQTCHNEKMKLYMQTRRAPRSPAPKLSSGI